METIQSIRINLEKLYFYGNSFDAEVIHHFIDLEIEKVTALGFMSYRDNRNDGFYSEYNEKDLVEGNFKNVIDIINLTNVDCQLAKYDIEFKAGFFVSYYEGEFALTTKKSELLHKYFEIILKQYGVYPERIYEYARQYPNHTLFIDRPGILTGIKDDAKDGSFQFITNELKPEPYTNIDVTPTTGKNL